MSRRKKPATPLVEGLRRKIERLIVREMIDKIPAFRANAQIVVDECNFPAVCGDPDCARAQSCARDLECYVLAHRTFCAMLPRMQAALGDRKEAVSSRR
jgi:hypothetical protein